MRNTILTAIAVTYLLVLATAASGDAKSAAGGLLAASVEERQNAQAQMRADHKKLIADLIAIVDDKDSSKTISGSMELAIQLLGDLRATEAIDTLTKHLTFVPISPDGTYDLPHMVEEAYPCAVALVSIGYSCSAGYGIHGDLVGRLGGPRRGILGDHAYNGQGCGRGEVNAAERE